MGPDMSQFMSQHLSLGLRQEQRLTPQLIQSMNILQLPLMALEAKVREEMERNPALEEVEPEGYRETEPDPLGASADTPPEAIELAEKFTDLERMNREYGFDDSDQSFGRSRSSDGERDAKLDAMANTASRPESLHEHLIDQWAFLEIPDDVRRAGELIMNELGADGYLRTPLEEIAAQRTPP